MGGHEEVMKLLLESSKFTGNDAVDASGRTALHCAAFRGYEGAVLLLLDHPNFHEQGALDASGRSAPHYALAEKHYEIAEILFKHSSFEDFLDGAAAELDPGKISDMKHVAETDAFPLEWVPQRGASFAELRFHQIRTAGLPKA